MRRNRRRHRCELGTASVGFFAGGGVCEVRLIFDNGARCLQKLSVNDKLTLVREKNFLAILCGIATAAILFATLWPFNPFPPNRLSWLRDANGLAFGGPGIALSKTELRTDGAVPGDSCSLELLLRPASNNLSTTILNFYRGPQEFAVRQWTDSLLVTRELITAGNKLKRVKLDVGGIFPLGKLTLLTMTFGPGGTVVYVDGRHHGTYPKFAMTRSDLSGQIVLGGSAVDNQPWPGEIRGLVVYEKELSAAEVSLHYTNWVDPRGTGPADLDGAIARYTFNERSGNEVRNAVASGPNLEIPSYFQIPQKPMLKAAWKEFEPTKFYAIDLLMNVAGFVPLGFIFGAYFLLGRSRGQAILYATLLGGALSFTIEVLQAYIPQRYSGTTDIITNTLGTFLGAALARPNMMRAILGKAKLINRDGDSAS
jgi:hypothetical protein